jgi:hypothetical protein
MIDQEREDGEIRRDIVTRARLIEDKHSDTTGATEAFERLGICCRCENLSGFVTKFGTKVARCREFGVRLTENNTIDICTAFWNRGHSDIKNLVGMATLIDVKRKIGFGDDDDYL